MHEMRWGAIREAPEQLKSEKQQQRNSCKRMSAGI
jgi:hypothetical protein